MVPHHPMKRSGLDILLQPDRLIIRPLRGRPPKTMAKANPWEVPMREQNCYATIRTLAYDYDLSVVGNPSDIWLTLHWRQRFSWLCTITHCVNSRLIKA